jgi:hypothetical protein
MTRADLITAIRAIEPKAKGLTKLKKAGLQARLDELQKASATVETIPLNCHDCGAFHPGSVLERTGGTCPSPKKAKKARPSEACDWKQMFDSPASNEHWSGPDSGRWCGTCGNYVRNVAATKTAPPCAGKPAGRVLTVKGIKTFQGMEGSGFNATLYEDGVKLGMVIDEGCGGSYLYRLASHEKERELACWARVERQQGMEPLDALINDLVVAEEERRWLKRNTRKKTVFKLKGQGPGEWSTYNEPYTDKFAAWVRKKHGDDLVEIANERDLVKA